MTPHMSGTSIDAQKRYAAGTKKILDSYFSGREDYNPADLIVHKVSLSLINISFSAYCSNCESRANTPPLRMVKETRLEATTNDATKIAL